MSLIKKPIINYTHREFETIKEDLINYAQKYYPQAFKDFSEASFGSLMLDLTAYIGDVLSFYIDYQANESFLATANEFKNVLNLSKQFGYKYQPNPSSFGAASFFISIPVMAGSIGPNSAYSPILRKGSTFSAFNGALFTLMEDVDFGASKDIVVAASDAAGSAPTGYAVKAEGIVISGELLSNTFTIKSYEKFLRLPLRDANITEVVSVYDSNGNSYYEVDYLTQDVVYVSVTNTGSNQKTVRNILKPISVPRRYVVEHDEDGAYLQFGFGTLDNEQRLLDPTNVILNIFGKDYFPEKSFDPTVLIRTDKLGLVPSDTTLTVVYRKNSTQNINIAANGLRHVVAPQWRFLNQDLLDNNQILQIQNSLEVMNEEPISGDPEALTSTELKQRAYGTYGAQNRAVTKDDYVNLIYNMPANFGQVKKATISRDTDSFNGKNLNLYVKSINANGAFIDTNTTIKQNLVAWINKYKMLGDTIDILDAKVMNLEIFFTAMAYANVNKYDVLQLCINSLAAYYQTLYFDIGEPFSITNIYKILNSVSHVLDVKDVTVVQKFGAGYSDFSIAYEDLISPDGRYLMPPPDVVFELKNLQSNITGEIL